MNARRWMGEEIHYDNIYRPLRKELNCSFRRSGYGWFNGTHHSDIYKVTKKYAHLNGFTVTKEIHPSTLAIRNHILWGSVVILGYLVIERVDSSHGIHSRIKNYHKGHWTFVHRFEKNEFHLANDEKEKISIETMNKYCEMHLSAGGHYPIAFILRKKKR